MRNIFLYNTTKRWLTIIAATAIVGIGLSALLIAYGNEFHLIQGTILTALLAGIPSILFILSKQTQRIIKEIKANTTEIRASHSLHNIIKTKSPLNLGGWAVDAHFLNVVIKKILLREPKLIVECGSGTSTIVSSYCLQQIGSGRVVSLDHSEDYARITGNLLKFEGLESRSEILYAPLTEQMVEGEKYQWYNPDFISRLKGEKIDMLIIDGPPMSVQKLSRYPAIPILRDFLSENCIILMDDGNRKDETLIAHKWAEQLNAELTYVKDCKGYWMLDKLERRSN